jgi:protein TonB
VVVQVIVEKDGSIGEQKVLRSVHPVLDAEAMRVVNIMPKWVPGMIDGKPARVKYALPVTFKL